MPNLTNTLANAGAGIAVTVQLVGKCKWSADGTTETLLPWSVTTDAQGVWTATLPAQSAYEGDTYYLVREPRTTHTCTVADSPATQQLRDRLMTPVPTSDLGTLALDDLSDVTTSGALSGKVLGFDGAIWKPVTASGGGGGGGSVNSVTNADSTITVAGTATDPTIAVNVIPESKVTNLVPDLAGKAASVHTHAESDVTSLIADLASKVPLSTWTTKGDILVATGASTPTRLPVGSTGQVPTADSTQTSGIRWSTPPAFNARDYGVVGDGVADDTTALNAWVAAAKAANARLYLPAGTYKITSALNITWWTGFQMFGDGMVASIIYAVGAGVGGLILTPDLAIKARSPLLQDIMVRGNTFGATGPGTTGDGIVWATVSGAVVSAPQMRRVRVEGFGGHGIRVQPTFDWLHFEDCHAANGGAHGIYFNTTTRLGTVATIVGGDCSGNAAAGVKATGNLTLLQILGHESSFNDTGYEFDTSEGSPGWLYLVGCRGESIATRHVDLNGAINGARIEHFDALGTPTNGGSLIKATTSRDVTVRSVVGRAMVNGTAVVEEASGAHVTYQDMERCVGSVVSGTAYMRKDPAGILYKPDVGMHVWGMSQEVTTFTANLDLTGGTAGSQFVMDCASASRTVTLPDATLYKGRVFTFIKKSGSNTMTVQTTLSQLLNGLSSLSFTAHGHSVSVTSDGVVWFTVARTDVPVGATSSVLGTVQLAGDLGGTASAPTVPALASKADLTSGKVPTTELGTGSASSTTFLRGDQTWATPAGGGGGSVNSVTNADSTITVAGTATDPTIAVNVIPESKVTGLTADLALKAMALIATATKTANYPAATGDLVRADSSGGVFTVTLPASTVGALIAIKKTDSSTNAVNFGVTGGDTIDGVSSGSLVLPNQVRTFLGVAGGWTVKSGLNTLTSLDARYALDSTLTTKGDIFIATAAGTLVRQGVGSDGQTVIADSTKTNGVKYGSTVNVQTLTANGTYTKPAGITAASLLGVGNGAGGGSGRVGAAGTVRCGGGGGGGGGRVYTIIPASVLGATEAVTVATGAPGGAAVPAGTTDTNGNAGTVGTATTFGVRGSNFLLTTRTAGAGAGGTNSTGTGGASGGTGGNVGGNGGAASATGSTGNSGTDVSEGSPGGGAGGGITSADVPNNGGGGGKNNSSTSSNTTGGIAPGGGGGNGVNADANSGRCINAGAGGAASITGDAGAGGTGGSYGAGGGGGGAGLNTHASGAGGAGGDGILIAVSW